MDRTSHYSGISKDTLEALQLRLVILDEHQILGPLNRFTPTLSQTKSKTYGSGIAEDTSGLARTNAMK